MSSPEVHPTNADQARAWDGSEGASWATHHEQLDAVLGHYQPAFEVACDIHASDRVLDIGCGTGGTTRSAARSARDGTALGVDLSAQMLDVARRISADAGLRNVGFAQVDAQMHRFPPQGHDVVISRTGAMFFGRPEQAFANIARSMRPGARLTLLTWQSVAVNPWFGAFADALLGTTPTPPPHAPGPFSMSDPREVTRLLEATGFRNIDITGLTGPTTYGRDIEEAHDLLTGLLGWMLDTRSPDDRPRAAQALHDTLSAHAGPDGVQFDSATWLFTARRL
jgi:ubiquinone/menaquinone biosynthesis C-methylase UbiE